MQSYTYYTYFNSHALPKQSEDETNLTKHYRTLDEYNNLLSISPEESLLFHLESLKESGRKICILDCGAGSGKVIDELLSGPYADCIEKCIGISLHYFRDVAELFRKHQTKVEWIIGPAEYILPNLSTKFDLIFDVYGAYHYSPKRSLLIEQYHRVLELKGRAHVFINSTQENKIPGNSEKSLEKFYVSHNPETFSFTKRPKKLRPVLVITKIESIFPGVLFKLNKVLKSADSIADPTLPKKLLLAGNAWRPTKVFFTIINSSAYPCSPESNETYLPLAHT